MEKCVSGHRCFMFILFSYVREIRMGRERMNEGRKEREKKKSAMVTEEQNAGVNYCLVYKSVIS